MSREPSNMPAAPPPPALEEGVIRQESPGPAVVERWIDRARNREIRVRRCSGAPAAVGAAIEECLRERPLRRCLLNAPRWEEPLDLARRLAAAGMAVVRWREPGCARAAFDCDAAVTDCRAALADTGALLVWSDAGFGRSSTLVVPRHVVVLAESQILPDLVDGLRLVEEAGAKGGGLPSNLVLINGPSTTADIEMNAITGVHGPRELWVVLVQEN